MRVRCFRYAHRVPSRAGARSMIDIGRVFVAALQRSGRKVSCFDQTACRSIQ